MNLLKLFGFGTKSQRTRAKTKLTGAGRPIWSERNTRAFAKEGYQWNSVVFSCIELIVKNASTVPIKVMTDNGEAPANHPLSRLVKRPNPIMDFSEFMGINIAFHRLTGESYMERIMGGVGDREILNLWPWPSYAMLPVVPNGTLSDSDSPYTILPTKWVYMPNGSTRMAEWDVDPLTGLSDMLQIKTWNPLNSHRGMSPMEAAAMSGDIHNDANRWNKVMLQNNGQPSGILSTKEVLEDDEYKQVKKRLADHKGSRHARDQLVIDGGFEWHQLGLSPAEMDWLAGKKDAASDIALVFRVPTQMVNIEGAQTFANYGQARLSLIEENILPLLNTFLSKMNHWNSEIYPGAWLEIDKTAIPALQDKQMELWDRANSSTALTINEKREILGKDPWEPGQSDNPADQIWIPSGLLPLELDIGGSGTNEEALDDVDAVLDDIGGLAGDDTDLDEDEEANEEDE